MSRETKINSFEVFGLDYMRVRISIFSTIDDKENFSADLNLPIVDLKKTPEEIKKETYEKLVTTFKDVLEDLRNITV